MSGVSGQPGTNQQCFTGLLAVVLSTASTALSSLRQTVRQNSIRAEQEEQKLVFGPRSREVSDVKDTLTGEAQCFGPKLQVSGRCSVRLRGDMVLLEQAEAGESAALVQEDSIQVTGALVDCSGTTVSLSRSSSVLLRMTLESEKLAGLWATKIAVAGGNSESISKLFSIQRRRIQSLEQHSQEALLNNEQVERCLNFLSREYVEMRYQVRTAPLHQSTHSLEDVAHRPEDPTPKPEELKSRDYEECEEVPLDMVQHQQSIHQSEPEKEPLEMRQLAEAMPESELRGKGDDSMGRVELGRQGSLVSTGQMPNLLILASPKQMASITPLVKSAKTPTSTPQYHRGSRTHVHDEHDVEGPRRERRASVKEPPAPSPVDRSPYEARSPVDALLDRRGHKLAMAHQRVLARRNVHESGQNTNSQQARKSVRTNFNAPSSVPSASPTAR